MSSTTSILHQNHCPFHEWMNIQELDLSELKAALEQSNSISNTTTSNQNIKLSELSEKAINRYQCYIDQRKSLSSMDASILFAPTWCTSLENSLIWMGGCKPVMFIRLIYSLCGLVNEDPINKFLEGIRITGLKGLSTNQLDDINNLLAQTILEEDKLSNRLDFLQENIVENRVDTIVKQAEAIANGEFDKNAEHTILKQAEAIGRIVEEADKLRMNTVKELVSILSPVQGVEFLAASKQLHLRIHSWG